MGRAQVNVPLDIPDVRVLKQEINQRGELIITIESTKTGTNCRVCGKWAEKLHGKDDWVVVRHLPVFGHASYLRYRPKRYQCQNCEGKPTTTERLEWREGKSPHTVLYEEHLLVALIGSTIEDVSIKEQIGYAEVVGVLERRMDGKANWGNYASLEVLGIDEIALKKGHRNYVTIVTARLKSGLIMILGVLEDREKDTIIDFLRTIPKRLCDTIHTVCCDMYEGFSEAVREELKTTQIVVDRFHVTRHYHEAADDLRQQELKRLKKELSEKEYKLLKGNMWAFRKKPEGLSPEDHKVLKKLFKYAPTLKQAYDLRLQLTAIFDQLISKADAEQKIKDWIQSVKDSGLSCFDKFLNTLDNWWDEITNFFVARANSGFVEGLNNKIKVLKRRCYGIFNLTHLFQRISLDLDGYRLFGLLPQDVA